MTRHRVIALAMAALLGVGLAGCSNPVDEAAEQLTEQALEGAGAGDIDVDIDDDTVTVTDDEGNALSAGEGASIPDAWPGQVPPYEGGELMFATVQSEGTASALWETSDSVEDATARYDDQLTAAGFTLDQEASMAGAQMRSYTERACWSV